MLGKFINIITIVTILLFVSIVTNLISIYMVKKEKKTSRLNAWKVKPELADRFLDVLTNNGYKWMSGHMANEFCPIQDDVPLLFIEGATKRIYYTRYFSYPDNLEEEYNVTDVTEEWLEDMENEGVVRMRGNDMETLIKNVEEWAHEKEIDDYKNWEKQFMKFQEEAFELYKEMLLDGTWVYDTDKTEMKLEMGDVLVTLIVLAKQQDIELSECLSMAWDKIKDRRGKTINGQFVKEEDL